MITINFFLKKERLYSDGTCPVFFQISFNGNRIRRPVQGVRISLADWDTEKLRVRKSKRKDLDNNHKEFNTRIDELESKIRDINKHVFMNKVPITEKLILDRLKDSHKIEADKKVLAPLFEEYLAAIKSTSTKRTILGKRTVLNFLKGYQEHVGLKMHISDLNKTAYEDLRKYAYDEKGIGVNYFAKIIATIKTFMQWALEKGLHETVDFKKFSAPEKETEIIYLTVEELLSLYNHSFSSPRLDRVRDVYCFCCFTGLRISDAVSLKSAHIQNGQITKVIEKTKEINSIPLNRYAQEILSKYKDTVLEPLPRISSQKFNAYIKECCEIVGINTPTTIVRFSGGTREEFIYPKHQLITSHTARKTFATNSLILGMKEMVVRNITGHKKEESFRRYVKIADKVKVDEMNKTWDKIQQMDHA